MDDLSTMTLGELLDKAHNIGALDGWESADESVVFELSNITIAIEKPSAKRFVRDLIKGYKRAAAKEQERQGIKGEAT